MDSYTSKSIPLTSSITINAHTGEIISQWSAKISNMSTIKFNYKVPVVAYDRVHVNNYQNQHFDILFLKTTTEGENEEADVVAAVRCVNQEQLGHLISTISDVLKKETEREP